ncbi:hypothetical protein [Burkholderia lata]|uniref:hypothetical protein n=1 Tax=Burkholderia lata (strain ATCC 17760 / DSM 23089 / LMG 22485 / NCIMB 9086 / R18194 / 383) TaxID=482957 RepID=UPI0015822C6C|nr:hypothetical protein [Burkholderia lata]
MPAAAQSLSCRFRDLHDDAARFGACPDAARVASASPGRGGFLMRPEPVDNWFVGAELPTGVVALYDTVVSKRDHVFDATRARFRYRGTSEREIARAIGAPLSGFRYTLADAAVPSRWGWSRDRLADAPFATAWARYGGWRGGTACRRPPVSFYPAEHEVRRPICRCRVRLERLRA